MFLFFKLAFLLAHHHRQVISQNIQLPENVVCPKVIGERTSGHRMAFYLFDPCFADQTLLVKLVQTNGTQVEVACIADVLVNRHKLLLSKIFGLYTMLSPEYLVMLLPVNDALTTFDWFNNFFFVFFILKVIVFCFNLCILQFEDKQLTSLFQIFILDF